MKYTPIIILFIFLLLVFAAEGSKNIVGLSSTDSNCKKASRIIEKVDSNFHFKGIYIYRPKGTKLYTENGVEKRKIIKPNREITFLSKLTGISPETDLQGAFIITEDVLIKWHKWLANNCTSQVHK